MNSLPPVTDPTFREQLRAAREARGLSQYALAKKAGIAGVMPKRYEDASDRYATLPNPATLQKLNEVLFPAGQEQAMAPGRDTRPSSEAQPGSSLAGASIEDIVAELRRRGAASVVINWS